MIVVLWCSSGRHPPSKAHRCTTINIAPLDGKLGRVQESVAEFFIRCLSPASFCVHFSRRACVCDALFYQLYAFRVLRAVSKNWAMLWQTAMLVVVVLFIFAAVGTAWFEDDFALGGAVEAVRDDQADDNEDFNGCSTLGEVRCGAVRCGAIGC